MTGSSVRRTDETTILRNHEDRIAALERAPSSPIVIDTQILSVASDNVLFSVPSGRTILELTWQAILDGGSVGDPCFAGLLFNGDATSGEPFHDFEEYRWNVGIPNDAMLPGGTFVSIDELAYFNTYGVVSWVSIAEWSWGRLRFPAYNIASAAGGGGWIGESAVGTPGVDDSNPGVCSGGREDFPVALTAISMIATETTDASARQQFAAGSWFSMSAY